MPVSATFHSSMSQPKPSPGGTLARTPSPKPSPMATGAPSEVTEASFSRWKVELQAKMIVEQEKEAQAERKKYKAHEDGKFWEKKQNLHKKTADQFGKAKMEVEAVRQSNLTRGAEYKAELEEMKEMAAQQREEWMQFGHELTVQHGPEQAERTKARLAETAEAKAEMGRQVKQEAQLNNKQRHTQRTNRLEEKREWPPDPIQAPLHAHSREAIPQSPAPVASLSCSLAHATFFSHTCPLLRPFLPLCEQASSSRRRSRSSSRSPRRRRTSPSTKKRRRAARCAAPSASGSL